MLLAPRAAGSDVEDAVFLSSRYGLVADEWQESVLEGWLGRRSDGRWAAPRCGLAVPRQNGKNALIEIRELFGMVILGEKFLHTAHEVKTARKAFLRLCSFFENERQYPELAVLVQEIRRTNGQEAVTLKNGGGCEFISRSKGSGRGFTVDCLVMDEAQELNDDALAALLPTISAAPQGNPQQIVTGTPPGSANTGEVFTRVRNAGVEGKDRRLCWFEWSCEGDVDLNDPRLWAQANPALGVRLNLETISDERAAMDDDTFARERLGMWETKSSHAVIDPHAWLALADPKTSGSPGSAIDGPFALAVDVTPDRSRTSLAVAGLRSDGLEHVELIENEAGTAWAVDRVTELVARWKPAAVVLDPAGPAGGLITSLAERGVEVLTVTGRDVGQACGGLFDVVAERRLRHLGQPQLAIALAAARKRAIGDAWGWSRKDTSVDISPLVAVTLARWAFMTSRTQKRPGLTRAVGRTRSY